MKANKLRNIIVAAAIGLIAIVTATIIIMMSRDAKKAKPGEESSIVTEIQESSDVQGESSQNEDTSSQTVDESSSEGTESSGEDGQKPEGESSDETSKQEESSHKEESKPSGNSGGSGNSEFSRTSSENENRNKRNGEPDWIEVSRIEATCGRDGKVIYQDLTSAEVREEVLPKLEHKFELSEHVDATCAKEGYDLFLCVNCGEGFREVIGKLDHDPGEAVRENIVQPTCDKSGSFDQVVYCTYCGEELDRKHGHSSPLDGDHEWGEGEVTKEATDTETGIIIYTCSKCGEVKEEVIPVRETEIRFENYSAPTATEPGSYTIIVFFKDTGEVISSETVTLPAIGEISLEEGDEIPVPTDPTIGVNSRTVGMMAERSVSFRFENYHAPTTTSEGSYDFVVFYEDNGEIISTTHVVLPVMKVIIIHGQQQPIEVPVDPTIKDS